MKTSTLEVKSQGTIVASLEYEYPENLDEAIAVDGEEKVLSLFLTARKTAEMNKARAEATGTGGVGVRALVKALKDRPDLMERLKAELNLDAAGEGDQSIAETE